MAIPLRNRDYLLYAVHAGFWGSFGLTRLVHRGGTPAPSGTESPPLAPDEASAPYSRALLVLHTVAFGLMYIGIGNAVIPDRVPRWFPGQRLVGTGVIALGAVLMSWAIVWFRSWRFRAKVDRGHELATGGPFRFVRHPIYLGLSLLALGTACWIPTGLVWAAAGLMVLGSDLRVRTEEGLLVRVFGQACTSYRARTARFLPGIY